MIGARRGRRRGAAAIEFALILPVYVALTCAIADWCWFVYCRTAVQEISMRAARAGALADPLLTPSPQEIGEASALSLLEEAGFDTSATVVNVHVVADRNGNTLDLVVDQPFHSPSQVVGAWMSLALYGHGSAHMEYGG